MKFIIPLLLLRSYMVIQGQEQNQRLDLPNVAARQQAIPINNVPAQPEQILTAQSGRPIDKEHILSFEGCREDIQRLCNNKVGNLMILFSKNKILGNSNWNSARTERLAFSDFRLIGPFVEKCRHTINILGCGSLTPYAAHKDVKVPHTQGMTLECLIEKVATAAKGNADPMQLLEPECRHELIYLQFILMKT
uniref:Secreted protein n=1 Tax=Heterorhabditis bacteriophora TaxID=37862 RepID=A0A1I7X6Y0_HETBA